MPKNFEEIQHYCYTAEDMYFIDDKQYETEVEKRKNQLWYSQSEVDELKKSEHYFKMMNDEHKKTIHELRMKYSQDFEQLKKALKQKLGINDGLFTSRLIDGVFAQYGLDDVSKDNSDLSDSGESPEKPKELGL
jgi:DNA repair ATPase RecN